MRNEPIIQSLLDTDLYKFTMMQVVFHQYPGAQVTYAFRCRNKSADLVPFMAEIQEEIDAYCELTFKPQELAVLNKMRFIKPDFTDFLEIYRPRSKHVKVVAVPDVPGAIDIQVEGSWWATIPFEVPCLAIVNEVYFRNTYDMAERARLGEERLLAKIAEARKNPEWETFRFNEFGTRRRMSHAWQDRVLTILQQECPKQLVATSNVYFADKFNLTVMGTMAHEYLQAFQALGPRLRDSQTAALDAWAKEYNGDLGIALTDVIGMDAFLRDFNLYYTKLFDGLRHDSGNPFEWADKALAHYEKMRVSPKEKALVFSDGLTFEKAMALKAHVGDRAKSSFGIGTYLTNDTGVPAMDVVMKMVRCNGQDVAKLSDSPGKTMCKNPAYVEYLRSVFAKEN